MDILITDITEMHAGNYCVAGWNATDRQMIRQDISSRLMASNLVGGLFEGESNHVVDVRLDGSAKKAREVDPPFQRLVFIEPHKKRNAALAALKAANPHRDIECFRDDGNASWARSAAQIIGVRRSARAVAVFAPSSCSTPTASALDLSGVDEAKAAALTGQIFRLS